MPRNDASFPQNPKHLHIFSQSRIFKMACVVSGNLHRCSFRVYGGHAVPKKDAVSSRQAGSAKNLPGGIVPPPSQSLQTGKGGRNLNGRPRCEPFSENRAVRYRCVFPPMGSCGRIMGRHDHPVSGCPRILPSPVPSQGILSLLNAPVRINPIRF